MKNKTLNLLKRVVGTVMLPLVMYLIVMWMCYASGKQKVFDRMLIPIIPNIAVSICCALGIGLQFKNGRFDFSGGAIMLLSAIIAGNLATQAGNSLMLLCVLSVVCCVVFSLLVGLFYVKARVPIIITTIGFALLYESITCLIFDGTGILLLANMSLNRFARYPLALIPAVAAIMLYALYSYLTTSGHQAALLAKNQQSAVNIGINENRNVLISYLFSGLIFGCAAIIWAAASKHDAAYTSMATVGQLFSNILPVFIGLMVAKFCGDTIGTVVGAITLGMLSYGLAAVFSNNLSMAIGNICMGVFILLINVLSAQGRNILKTIGKIFGKSIKN